MKTTGAGIAAATAASAGLTRAYAARDYDISLAGWSLHRTIGTSEGKTPMLDMPKLAREEWDIGAIELVNNMLEPRDDSFPDMKPYLDQLSKNAAFHNVRILLIMVDGQGNIGGEEQAQRDEAVTKHSKWIDIAEYLGCHSIRMNWAGAPHEVVHDEAALAAFIERSVPGFRALCEYGDGKDINVIIENHGGASSYPAAMERLMAAVGHPRFGTLPDFGNFPEDVDLYDAIDRLMNFAKAVSAKCYDFDDTTGDETKLDFPRIIENVVDKHGYHGYIGIEFEGDRLSEFEGIRRCKALLDRLKA